MKRMALVLALLLVSSAALGQCNPNLRVQSPTLIALNLCPGTTAPAVGDPLTIEAGGGQIVTTVTLVKAPTSPVFAGLTVVNATLTEPAKAQENMLLLVGIDTATVKLGSSSLTVTVQKGLEELNTSKTEWSVGPATKGNSDEAAAAAAAGSTSTSTVDNALRFRYTGDFARGGFFGRQMGSLLQTTASLSIDTTDQSSPDFIDNNQVSLGARVTNLSFGRLLMHGNIGIEARLEKAFHQDLRNVDAVVTASGWIPVIPSLTLFSHGDFIDAPLSFKASYGYRDRSQGGESVNGRVFEGSALYHLYLLDQFQVNFSATITHNDLDSQPANTPRTQRLYKGTIAYLENPNSGFKVLTSIEDGSAGVMLRKVRQYFIGIALSKIDLKGGS